MAQSAGVRNTRIVSSARAKFSGKIKTMSSESPQHPEPVPGEAVQTARAQTAPTPLNRSLLMATAFGAGFAVMLAILAGAAYLWMNRPKPWTSAAITATPTRVVAETSGEELHLQFRYALTNHTNADYIIMGPENAALMRRLPGNASLQRLDGAKWDATIRIPVGQTVNVVFDVPIRLADYNTTADELNSSDPNSTGMPAQYSHFVQSRLGEMDGLVFMDYADRYRIDLPKDWQTAR
jgi:hypothetical protein